ncbi:hypothetical protein [Sphingomonas phage Carli]|nr:hypothetical protein [Sphingomonas phage Carli]
MAYGDLPLDAPEKPNKGHEGGACNRRACQAEPALWYNHGSYSWYCEDCAKQIGGDHVNERNWYADFARFFPRQERFPMFETREMMDTRESVERTSPATIAPRQQGKTVMLENVRLSYPSIQPPAAADERRYHAVIPTYPNRQQRRAAERAAFKRLPNRS